MPGILSHKIPKQTTVNLQHVTYTTQKNIFDEYIKNPSKADYRKKKLKVFDHQIHQKLGMDVIGVSFDAQ